MNKPDKNKLLKWNSILWVAAMVIPALLSIVSSAKILLVLVPLLLLGPMLASNGFISKACGTEDDTTGSNSL